MAILLVAVGFGQIHVYLRQANIMQRQTDISAQQASDSEAVQRAFVSVDWAVSAEQMSMAGNEARVPAWRFAAAFSNKGTTPTRGLEQYGLFLFCDASLVTETKLPTGGARVEGHSPPITARSV